MTTHFEEMEKLGQTNMFEFLEEEEAPAFSFRVGDEVKLTYIPGPNEHIIDALVMEYNFRHLLGKRAEIVGVFKEGYIYEIESGGERHFWYAKDLILL